MAYNREHQIFGFRGLDKGLDQASCPDLTDGSELIENLSLDRIGNISTRPGSDLLGSKIGTNQGYGLWDYNSTSGTHKLFAAYDRDIYAYTEGTTTWGTIDTDEWVDAKKVNGVDFLNRSYIGCESGTDPLAYTTGGAITDIVPTIGGHVLAVNKSILAVGGNNILPNTIFFTQPYSDRFHLTLGTAKADTATCRANADEDGTGYVSTTTNLFPADIEGMILYNSSDSAMARILDWIPASETVSGFPAVKTDSDTSGWNNDTIYVLENSFSLDNTCKASTGYSDNFISCDEFDMYIWDPTIQPAGFQRKVPGGFGCVNDRAMKAVNGLLFGMSRNGIWMKNGPEMPIDIATKVRSRVNGYGILDLINQANWNDICMGAQEAHGQLFISLGTLNTLAGAPLSGKANVVLILDIKTGQWTYRTYPDQIVAFTNFIDSTGKRGLYGIGKGDAGVWKMDTGTTDDNAEGVAGAISYEYRTPHHVLFELPLRSDIESVFIKYTATNSVTVTHSVDRGSYTTLGTLAASSTVKIQEIPSEADSAGFSHSLKFTGTGQFILEAYQFLAKPLDFAEYPSV